jgi:methionine sulfoxide reductase heme-binding subunit
MDGDLFFWILARVCGLSAFAALSIALLTGAALRTAVLDWLATNRALRSVHEFSAVLWIPLGMLHVAALVLDRTARIAVSDLVIPFQVHYPGVPQATLAIGLGTVTLELFAVVAVTGWLKRRIGVGVWQWIHRLSYVAFAVLFLHAVLAGSDFSDPAVSALTWAVAFVLGIITLARVLWGRLPA